MGVPSQSGLVPPSMCPRPAVVAEDAALLMEGDQGCWVIMSDVCA